MHQRSSVGDGRFLPTSSDVTNQWPGLVSRRCWFTRHLSTYHPLLRLTEKISSGFRRGRSTGAVFLDNQKVFDRVRGLIYKLITNNFPPALIHLISSY
ncbi:hypothetical protein TNCV_4693911 [Trichonephila clavipes]|uniref:Reverse transcriptase domain-containing protein n=1 Tax=Trichonephila clavipes TaxID=2585209 RepID=A0A8X7BIF2_TRICX|nr:hypothetical protein TNCV_4693911 [Trichonephila clavipes]